ncbi:MAG: hypothetical protein JSV33_07575 [bacterium]|nr:MAG: hypothetical protein JSV33_07575 [bacterium]
MRKSIPVILFLCAVLLASCGERGTESPGEATYKIDRNFVRGPVTFRVAVSEREVTIAQRVTMLLETRASEGYQVELPRFGEKLHEFGIVDYTNPPPELASDGVVVTRRTYELEPFLSGEYRIPPMTVTFWEEGDTTLHRVESDTITVAVTSILPEDQAGLDIKDIAGPLSIPRNPYPVLIIAGCIIAAALAVFLIWRHRKRRVEAAPIIPPHEIAYRRLENLLASGLLEEKRYKEFTTEVSDILRHYIEDRFGLRAPERTTEEFLAEAGAGLPVDNDQKRILEAFLVHCDMVKFAAHEPTQAEVKRTFETCRDFVDETATKEEVREEAA